MKTTLSFIFLIFIISCSRPGDPNPNNPPPNPQDSAAAAPKYYGKILWLGLSSLYLFDGNIGNTILEKPSYYTNGSGPFGLAFEPPRIYHSLRSMVRSYSLDNADLLFAISFPNPIAVNSTNPGWPVIDGNNLYTAGYEYFTGEIHLFCLNKISGAILWRGSPVIGTDPYPQYPTPAVLNDKVYISLENGPACFDKNSGALIWSHTTSPDYIKLSAFPIIYNNQMVVFASNSQKKVFSFDPANGNLIWTANLTSVPSQLESLVRSDTLITFSTPANPQNIMLNFIKAPTGQLMSQREITNQKLVGIDGNTYYAHTNLVGISYTTISKNDLITGNNIWSKNINGSFYFPVVTDSCVYFLEDIPGNSVTKKITILNKKNGDMLKSFQAVNGMTYGDIYVITNSGKAYSPLRY
jgi:outer membrane protein assembly factor BamB